MGKIRVLEDTVANQIAAGEVVERPVAVVKELVENSLDAGATRVSVEFSEGGKRFIRVEDNGSGMDEEDAALCLARHGTSKIREAADLDEISSFGFRGEAVPSIASVSRFLLRTRRAEDAAGTEIEVHGGKVVARRQCGMAQGSVIEVSDLFYPVPARRKFLKTDNTEAAHIVQCVRLLALANPECAFTLREDGRTLFQSPACPSLRERIREILGRDIASQLMEFEATDDTGETRVHGLVGRPGASRATRQELIVFVNRRPVENRTLLTALTESYHTWIPRGRYPLAIIFLEMDPRRVDVNVHPAKREVRFRDEARLRNFMIEALVERLRAAGSPSAMPGTHAAHKAEPPPRAPHLTPPPAPAPAFLPPRQPAAAALNAPIATTSTQQSRPTAPQAAQPQPARPQPPIVPPAPLPAAARRASDWKALGVAHGRYATFETPEGLLVLNLRAARERIHYERVLRSLAKGGTPDVQPLLFPELLQVDALSATLAGQHADFFRRNGILLEPFGGNSLRLEGVPDWLDDTDALAFVRDLVDRMRDLGGPPALAEQAADLVARLAATRLKAAQSPADNDPRHLERLAADLLSCRQPLSAPDGRPTLLELTRAELDRRFMR